MRLDPLRLRPGRFSSQPAESVTLRFCRGRSPTLIQPEVAGREANPEEDVRDLLKLSVVEHLEPELSPGDGPGGLLHDRAPLRGDLCQSGPPIVGVGRPAHETLRLQSIDGIGDAGWMDL